MRRDLADQRDVFSLISLLFLTQTQRAPKISFTAVAMSGSVIKTFAGISFFPILYRFGVAVKENSIVLETYPRPRR